MRTTPPSCSGYVFPMSTVLLILFVISLFYHAQLGIQVVIEDYIGSEWQKITSIIIVNFLVIVGALASVLSILNVFFGFNAS